MNASTSVFYIKLVHTLIFFVLSVCVLYALYSVVADEVSQWTWIALLFVLLEGVILALSGWKCPLTTLAERLGASSGSVSDIFLPRWFADRLFLICGATFWMTVLLAVARWLVR